MKDGGSIDMNTGGAAVVCIDLVAVVDDDVPCVGEFTCAQQGRAAQRRDHINGSSGIPERLLEEANLRGWGGVAICDRTSASLT